MKIESPYCPVCDACGEEGCCSPLMCEQSPAGDYCEWYLRDLKFAYKMYQWMEQNIVLTPEQKQLLDEEWDKAYDQIYLNKNDNDKAPD